ncbi:hypothetical protein J2W97_003055 [Paenibacillus jamilae]|jgi:hypothetical protein|uniref:Uncharacterized protein n=1 Tax=Paenibacillus polymyxa TaxID=1406 RepID=A0A378XWC9_PAEPO|nr:hypothetical protein PPSQR21_020400 [Paenibacillus polymyxa SQR-21]MDP9677060.1 hypothetical protein [Paenibacillus jamilae]SPY17438.1 Uncharacterised protein [Paenibacillus polymyxa]SUA69342.1 Uncharacterised protein [Paenibacillus polymyxa]
MRFAPYYTCNENADIKVYNARRKRFYIGLISIRKLPFVIKYDNQGRVCCEFTQQNYNNADLPYPGDDAGFAGGF